MDIQNLHFEVGCQTVGDYHLGVTVKKKQENTITLHVYLLSNHFREVPKSHMFGLVTLLNAPNTPENILTEINPAFEKLTLKKNSLYLAHQLIETLVVDNFSEMEYKRHLWESRYHFEFNETSDLSAYKELMQADVTITVKDTRLIAHISAGMQWKSTSANSSPFWYLENRAVTPATYIALYSSLGGKWMSHEGEIGTEGSRKPVKGMTGYYMTIPKLGEDWVAQKIEEGAQLVYKNYDTKHYIEEDIRNELERERIANNQSTYSEEAFEAFKNKDIQALQDILEDGEHPDSLKNDDGDCLLHEIGTDYGTITEEHFEMFKLLLSHGANPNVGDFRPMIHRICYWRREAFGNDMIQLLLDHDVAIDCVSGRQKQSLLQTAAVNGKLFLLKHLLEKGHDINYTTKSGESALVLAIQENRSTVETLTYLLENGADKNELYILHDGKTILDRVVKNNRTDILKYLVALDVDLNMLNDSGYPCIFDCAEYGASEMFEEFVKLGAEVTPYLHNILHRLELRLCDKGFPRDVKETALRKLQFLHDNGYDVISYEILDAVIESLSGRKKIKKFEENIVISLLEMGYLHTREDKFLAYVDKVNSTAILNAYKKQQTEG